MDARRHHQPAHFVGARPATVIGIEKRDARRLRIDRIARFGGAQVEHRPRLGHRSAIPEALRAAQPGADFKAEIAAEPVQPGIDDQRFQPREMARRLRRSRPLIEQERADIEDLVIVGFRHQQPGIALVALNERRQQRIEGFRLAGQPVAGMGGKQHHVDIALSRLRDLRHLDDIGDQQPRDRRRLAPGLHIDRCRLAAQVLQHVEQRRRPLARLDLGGLAAAELDRETVRMGFKRLVGRPFHRRRDPCHDIDDDRFSGHDRSYAVIAGSPLYKAGANSASRRLAAVAVHRHPPVPLLSSTSPIRSREDHDSQG